MSKGNAASLIAALCVAGVTVTAIGARGAAARSDSATARPTFVDPERSEEAEALEANASGSLDKRVTDGRAVVAAFTSRSYRPGETAVINLWHRYSRLEIQLLHVGPED